MAGIGDTLRAARRQQARTLADAAAETRVREAYLAALEQEEFDVLGGDVYVKGFLRSYARYLHLDPEPLVQAYRAHHERPDDSAHALPPAGYSDPMLPVGDRSRPPRPLVVGVIAALAVLIVAGLALSGGGGEPVTAPDAPEPVETTEDVLAGLDPLPGTTAPAPAVTTAVAGPAFTAIEVEVRVVGAEAQVAVAEGQPPVQAVLAQGESRTITGERVVVRLGDATAVEVLVNGEPLALGAAAAAVEVTCAVGDTACEVRDV